MILSLSSVIYSKEIRDKAHGYLLINLPTTNQVSVVLRGSVTKTVINILARHDDVIINVHDDVT